MRRTRLRASERASRTEILAIQRRRLANLFKHAAQQSTYYRRRWRGLTPRPEELPDLEPVDKSSLLIDSFDEAVTVPGLTLDTARARLADVPQRQRGRHILVASSGTTGEPAVIPFSRRDWRMGMAYILRSANMAIQGIAHDTSSILRGFKGLPRVAGVSTLNPIHVSSQLGSSFNIGLVPSLLLPASMPLDQQMERLNCFQPTVLGGYPSALDPLSEAARDGILRISPHLVFAGGETVTAGLRRRVRGAWGRELFDFYGLTETLIIAGECRAHKGLHLYEDAVVLEVVDENGKVLPPGEPGAGILVTSLINRTLPIIRYAVGDRITLSDEPCPCGLPFRRILAIEGRSEELLILRKSDGETVRVHPFVIETPLEEIREVRRFHIRSDGKGGVLIVIVPARTEAGLAARVSAAVEKVLRPLGLGGRVIQVKMATSIESKRGSTDKLVRI
jgi:phenylacetate-coenzyme A ligase PaaK-like adenylate-forming protein